MTRPDRLDAVVAAAYAAGARDDLHNLGGVHADAHHAALSLDEYAPASISVDVWQEILDRHLTNGHKRQVLEAARVVAERSAELNRRLR